jgi:hypothetical protein
MHVATRNHANVLAQSGPGSTSMSTSRAASPQLKPDDTESIDSGLTAALERHFTPAELGELWGFDQTTIRRMFVDEPGVLKIGKQARRDGKRAYVSVRIPASIAQRVHARKTR